MLKYVKILTLNLCGAALWYFPQLHEQLSMSEAVAQHKAKALKDPLSRTNILNIKKKGHAIAFYGVLSTETKHGSSYYNSDEVDVVKFYVTKLVKEHHVKMIDIGIIATYRSQVEEIKKMLDRCHFKIDVETVDAFQGQEKRVILITTVRGKADNRSAALGFVTDVKRFNVALTRARAKVIVIGNPLSLSTSPVWKSYLQKCQKLGSCYGEIDV